MNLYKLLNELIGHDVLIKIAGKEQSVYKGFLGGIGEDFVILYSRDYDNYPSDLLEKYSCIGGCWIIKSSDIVHIYHEKICQACKFAP